MAVLSACHSSPHDSIFHVKVCKEIFSLCTLRRPGSRDLVWKCQERRSAWVAWCSPHPWAQSLSALVVIGRFISAQFFPHSRTSVTCIDAQEMCYNWTPSTVVVQQSEWQFLYCTEAHDQGPVWLQKSWLYSAMQFSFYGMLSSQRKGLLLIYLFYLTNNYT